MGIGAMKRLIFCSSFFLDAKHGAGERQGSFARNGRDWEGLMHWVGMDGVRDRRDLAWSMEHGA